LINNIFVLFGGSICQHRMFLYSYEATLMRAGVS